MVLLCRNIVMPSLLPIKERPFIFLPFFSFQKCSSPQKKSVLLGTVSGFTFSELK